MRLVLIQPPLGFGEEAGNLDVIRRLVATGGLDPAPDDVLLLPEHVDPTESDDEFVRHARALARDLGCHVVGGSHHCRRDAGFVNAGAAVAPDGTIVGRYEKLRPYADERRMVRPGTVLGEFVLAGRHVLVLVCADFWFSDLFQRVTRLPDIILVPALSVTRKPTPDYSRALWRHLAVARTRPPAGMPGDGCRHR
jgi:predicted amidohydrolase